MSQLDHTLVLFFRYYLSLFLLLARGAIVHRGDTVIKVFDKSEPNEALLQQLFAHAPVPTLVTDEDDVILMSNKAFNNLSGYADTELVGKDISLLYADRYQPLYDLSRHRQLSKDGYYEGDAWCLSKEGTKHLLQEKVQLIRHHNKTFYLNLFENITKSRQLTERYRYLAMHDVLTGLANRSLAEDRFVHALQNTVRVGEKLGILLCDLNEFKQVNDVYGHHIGDLLLMEVAHRLTNLVRKGDTVARLGGDEFLIIAERLKSEQELELFVKKVEEHMQTDLIIEGHTIHISLCIGDACSPRNGTTYEQLLRVADKKMYHDKERFYGL